MAHHQVQLVDRHLLLEVKVHHQVQQEDHPPLLLEGLHHQEVLLPLILLLLLVVPLPLILLLLLVDHPHLLQKLPPLTHPLLPYFLLGLLLELVVLVVVLVVVEPLAVLELQLELVVIHLMPFHNLLEFVKGVRIIVCVWWCCKTRDTCSRTHLGQNLSSAIITNRYLSHSTICILQ